MFHTKDVDRFKTHIFL